MATQAAKTPPAQPNPFFKEILIACNRIRAMDGNTIFVSQKPTTYVLPGHTFNMTYKDLSLPFWVGFNDKRLFFIAYNNITPDVAEEKFKFTFGGANKVGWELNYEKIELIGKEVSYLSDSDTPGVSIWGTCMAAERVVSRGRKEVTAEDGLSMSVQTVEVLTESGQFWATDIALMAQSWFRTCERYGFGPVPGMEPAPL